MADVKSHVDLILTERIRVEESLQTRESIDQATVDSYAELMNDGAEFPPLVVYFDKTDYWLSEGFHRIAAAKKNDAGEIACEIRLGGRREAFRNALGSNTKHGLMRSNADKRKAVTMALADEEFGKFSDRLLAELCSVNHNTVARFRAELLQNCSGGEKRHVSNSDTPGESKDEKDSKSGTSRVGLDGKTYPVTPKKNGTPEPTNGQHEAAAPAVPESPAKPKSPALEDDLGEPVPMPLVPVFQMAEDFSERVNEINAILRWLEEIKKEPAGANLRADSVSLDLRNAKGTIKFSRPYAVCPVCKGVDEMRKLGCQCKGHGWLCHDSYKALPSEYRQ